MIKLLVLLLGVFVLVMIVKNIKHKIAKEGLKYALILVLIVAGFLVANYFYDMDDVIDGGKGIVETTGAAVQDAYEESFDTDIIEDTKDKISDLVDR